MAAGLYDEMVFLGGALAPFVECAVRLADGTTPASIYSDRTLVTPLPNPTTTDVDANLHFYAQAGEYVLVVNGETQAVSIPPIDPSILPYSADASVPTFVANGHVEVWHDTGTGTSYLVVNANGAVKKIAVT